MEKIRTLRGWAELAIELGEGGAQLEIKDDGLRESLIINVEQQMQNLLNAQARAWPPTERENQGG
jgi:hypothetical protein